MDNQTLLKFLTAKDKQSIAFWKIVRPIFNSSNYKIFTEHIDNFTTKDWILIPTAECVTLGINKTDTVNGTRLLGGPNGTELIETDWLGLQCMDSPPTLTTNVMIRVGVLSSMAFVSMLGNFATILNIHKKRKKNRTKRNTWSAISSLIFHLSIADILVSIFCILGDAIWSYTVQWIAGDLACRLFKFLQMFSLYLSTYIMVLIGIDRWLAVKYPMKSLNTSHRGNHFVGIVYALSFVLSIPQAVVFHVARGPFYEEFYQCVTHGFYSAAWQEQTYTTFTLVVMFVIPLGILIGTYVSTFSTISKSERMFRTEAPFGSINRQSTTNRQRLIHRAKVKSLRISVVIVFAFIICWTPYYFMMVMFMFSTPSKAFKEHFQTVIFFFGMSNSLVNPAIYGAFQLRKRKTERKPSVPPTTSTIIYQHRAAKNDLTRSQMEKKSSHLLDRSPEEISLVPMHESSGSHTNSSPPVVSSGVKKSFLASLLKFKIFGFRSNLPTPV